MKEPLDCSDSYRFKDGKIVTMYGKRLNFHTGGVEEACRIRLKDGSEEDVFESEILQVN